MRRFSVPLSLALALGAVSGAALPPAAVRAAPGGPQVDPAQLAADWDKQWERALKDAAAEYSKLARKWEEKNLEATGMRLRWKILRYLPDDGETRTVLGYEKKDGQWVRNEAAKDKINGTTDTDDPKQTKFDSERKSAEKRISDRFRALARKAIENKGLDAANAAAWDERTTRGWERVVEIDSQNEDACKGLGYRKFQGKYASPYKLKFLEAREARKTASAKSASAKVDGIAAVAADGLFVSAGLTGNGARSAHMTINTTYPKESAMRMCGSAERALSDLCQTYGFDQSLKDQLGLNKIDLLKDEPEFRTFLEKGCKFTKAQVQELIDLHIGGTSAGPGESVGHREDNPESADDLVMALVSQVFVRHTAQPRARADLGSSVRDEVEDWLWQCIGYDLTRRLLGSINTSWAQFGRYGRGVETLPGEDLWIELARRLVESDEDIPLSKICKLKMSNADFHGPQSVRGYAFLIFLFEKDAEQARKFVWNALANGTPAAVAAVYPDNADSPDPEKSMEKLDAEYRVWIVKAWDVR